MITQLCALEELLARVRAVVRRRYGHSQSILRSGRLELNLVAREARIDNAPLRLGPKEYLLLEFLSLKRGSAVSKTACMTHLYGTEITRKQRRSTSCCAACASDCRRTAWPRRSKASGVSVTSWPVRRWKQRRYTKKWRLFGRDGSRPYSAPSPSPQRHDTSPWYPMTPVVKASGTPWSAPRLLRKKRLCHRRHRGASGRPRARYDRAAFPPGALRPGSISIDPPPPGAYLHTQ